MSTKLKIVLIVLGAAILMSVICYGVNNFKYRIVRNVSRSSWPCDFDCEFYGMKEGEEFVFVRGKVGFPFSYRDKFTGPHEEQLIDFDNPGAITPRMLWRNYVLYIVVGEILAVPLLIKVGRRAHIRH
jgi:hypothetical protein